MAKPLNIYAANIMLPQGVTRQDVGLGERDHIQVKVQVAAASRAAAARAFTAHGARTTSAYLADYGYEHPVREDREIDQRAAAEPGRVFVEPMNARAGDPVVRVPTNEEREAAR